MNSKEVWGFIEQENQAEIASEISRLGSKIGAPACGIVVGKVDRGLAEELGRFGIAKLYAVEPLTADPLAPEDYAHLVTCLIKKSPPYVCLFAASPLGNEVAGRLAVRLGAGLITWCVDFNYISGKLMAIKKAHSGRASKCMVWLGSPPYLATVDPEVMEAIAAEKVSLPVIEKERLSLPRPAVKVIGYTRLGWRDMPLTEATIVLGVGAGVKDKAGMDLIERFAELLDTPIGGTKRADEIGLIPREHRIGASGIFIEPKVYIAVGVSGASHHLVGTRKAKHVVAINQDKTAPIFETAELCIMDDYRPVLTAAIDRLR